MQIHCEFFETAFSNFCDVRSEYMSLQVRIDSSGSVGTPVLEFVCCSWFGIGNKENSSMAMRQMVIDRLLWLCASYDGDPVLVHRQRGTRVYFHQAIHDKKIIAIPGIHYSDAHRLQALLLNAPELQLHPRTGNLPEPEGAGDAVDDPSSEEELSTSDEEEADAELSSDEEPWCPPIPDHQMIPLKKNYQALQKSWKQ